MFTLRAATFAVFAVSAVSALQQQSTFEKRHISHAKQIERRDVGSDVLSIVASLKASVSSASTQVTAVLAETPAGGLVTDVESLVSGLQSEVAAALTSVQSLASGSAVTSTSTSGVANDITSVIAELESIIGQVEQAAADNSALAPYVIALADLLNGPLSEILLAVDQLLVGVVTLVGNLLSALGLGSVLSSILGGLGPVTSILGGVLPGL